MGIGSILGTALRGVAWGQVANAALQYGPEIIKKIKERRQGQPPLIVDGDDTVIRQLQEQVAELEEALRKQQELVVQQTKALDSLEKAARSLHSRLKIMTFMAAGLGFLSVVLLILLLKQ
jgi:TolA-binding protein